MWARAPVRRERTTELEENCTALFWILRAITLIFVMLAIYGVLSVVPPWYWILVAISLLVQIGITAWPKSEKTGQL
jgi:hypothetical protein